jgi:CubicO group peptidase (beta-lactamase class C family)
MRNLFLYILLSLNHISILLLTACTTYSVSLETLLQAELDEIRLKHSLPGITAAIVLSDGRVVSLSGGIADREHDIPMTFPS